MSNYAARIPHYIEAKSEKELTVLLRNLGLQLQEKLEVMTIYHNETKNRIVCWYFHDTKKNVPLPVNKTTKKKVKKKAE